MWVCKWESLNLSLQPTWFCIHRSCRTGAEMFLIYQVTLCDQVIKVHMSLWMGAFNPKSLLCQMGWLKVLWLWRYNIFILPCDETYPHDQRDILLGKGEPLNLGCYCTQIDGCRPCRSRDITFLLCHLTSFGHMIKETFDLVNGSLSP